MNKIINRFSSSLEKHSMIKTIVIFFSGLLSGVFSNMMSNFGYKAIFLLVLVPLVLVLILYITSWREDKERKRLEAKPTSEPLRERYKGLIVSISKLYDSYLFNWDNITECDKERLQKFLMDDLDLGWVEHTEISKSNDNKTMHITKDENAIEIAINKKKDKATLKISDGRTLNLKVKNEDGELKLYTATKDHVMNKINELAEKPEDAKATGLRELYEIRGVGQTFRAIKHHLGRLTVCWLLCTGDVKEGKEVVEYFINEFGHGTVTAETVHLDSPNKIESVHNAIDDIFKEKRDKYTLEEKEVIADVTGGTAIMSSAMTLACISSKRDIEYVDQKTYNLIKIDENITEVVHSR